MKKKNTGASMMVLNVEIYINEPFFSLVYGSFIGATTVHDGVFHHKTLHKPFESLFPAVC